jgi:hypothetical protein
MAYVNVEVDPDEFSDSELIQELEIRGYSCIKTGSICTHEAIEGADIDRIDHLATCGQTAAARTELLEMVSRVIGRDLTN